MEPNNNDSVLENVSASEALVSANKKVLEGDEGVESDELLVPSNDFETAGSKGKDAVGLNCKLEEPVLKNSIVADIAPLATSEFPIEPSTAGCEERHDNATVNAQQGLQDKSLPPQTGAISPSIVPEKSAKTPALPSSSGSVPPHLRPAYQKPMQQMHGLQSSKHSSSTPVSPHNQRIQDFELRPRQPRQLQIQQSFPRYDAGDSEQVARLHAQVMSLKNVLDAERRSSANMRKSIELEQRRKSDAAMSSLLTNLIHAQEEALASNARAEAQERDLEHRRKQISQMEVYLAEGQRQMHENLGNFHRESSRSMNVVDRELIKREEELAANRRLANAHGKLKMRSDRVRQREIVQEIREQQYKIATRAALEAEFYEATQAVANASDITEREYNRGFVAGKVAGQEAAKIAAPIVEQRDGSIEGYAAYHRQQIALDNALHGRIPLNDPELAFLFDTGHPGNLVARGVQMGQMGAMTATVIRQSGTAHGEATTSVINSGAETKPNGNGIGVSNGANGSYRIISQPVPTIAAAVNKATPPANLIPISNVHNDNHNATPPTHPVPTPPSPLPASLNRERPRKIPAARPTLAAELRGETPMHNGSYILANRAAAAAMESRREDPPAGKTGQFADVGPDLLEFY
ncbi:hypothetical protein IAQ61_011747 [Plenodomus lingam]|uniref:uncharacterized protein n=1 Tax=Leptosphaeria maculans TaxID=5022 RepID=UPI00331F7BCD|nr:hypothetical protein IAQ61_011747 [Plenodomus lingam]